MTWTMRRISPRLRNKKQLRHRPSGFGHGKWHSTKCLWAYKMKARKKRNIAEASRRRNWA